MGARSTTSNGSPFLNFEEFANTEEAWKKKRLGNRKLEAARKEFEDDNGLIVEEIWESGGGAVLTYTGPSRWRLRGEERRLHHHTPPIVVRQDDLYELERRLTALAAKTHDAIHGLPRTILLDQIFCELSSLYEYAARHPRGPDDPEHQKWIKTESKEVAKIEHDYSEAATRFAQVDYILAMGVGWLLLGIIGAAIVGLWRLTTVAVTGQLFFAALLGGGLGACISVLIRMSSGKFRILREPSRAHTWTLGALRPLIGAVFGVVAYFVALSGLLSVTVPSWDADQNKALAWTVSLAFVAGFSERFAKNIFNSAEKSVSAAAGGDGKGSS